MPGDSSWLSRARDWLACAGSLAAGSRADPGAVARTVAKTYAKGTRTFLGFEDDALRQRLRGLDGRVQGPPAIHSIRDASLVPLARVGLDRFLGGVFADGAYQPSLSLHRGYEREREARVRQPEHGPQASTAGERLGRAWFGGYLFDHYGHFLLEGLARALSPEVADSDDPVIFFDVHGIASLRPYMNAVFARVGIDPARIRLCGRPLRVGELRVQEPSFEIRGFVRPDVYRRVKCAGAAPPRSRMLYLSRSRLESDRTIKGEAAFEQWLTLNLAADVIAPETLSFEAQLDRLGGAQFVLGCEGAAFHSLIFLERPLTAVVLCGGLPNSNYLLCDELFDGNTIYVQTAMPADGGVDRMRWALDIEAAKRAASLATGSPLLPLGAPARRSDPASW